MIYMWYLLYTITITGHVPKLLLIQFIFLYQISMFPCNRRLWVVDYGISVAPQCFICNGTLWHILTSSNCWSSCNLEITLGFMAISLIFEFIVQSQEMGQEKYGKLEKLPLVIQSTRSSALLWNTRFTSSGRIETSFVWISTKPFEVACKWKWEVIQLASINQRILHVNTKRRYTKVCKLLVTNSHVDPVSYLCDWVMHISATAQTWLECLNSNSQLNIQHQKFSESKETCLTNLILIDLCEGLCALKFKDYGNVQEIKYIYISVDMLVWSWFF